MKKIIMFILILGSLLLGGCMGSKRGEIIKDGANASYDKLYLKDALSADFWANFDEIRTMSAFIIDEIPARTAPTETNAFAIRYAPTTIYSILNKKFFLINNESNATVHPFGDRQYLLSEDRNEFRVYSFLTTEGIYAFVKDPNYDYNFEDDYIEKFELIDGQWELKNTYYFEDYKAVEKAGDFSPFLDLSQLLEVNGYYYQNDISGIDIFKNGKYYTRYYFEPLMDDYFILGNGNILTLHIREIPNIEVEDYDYTDSGLYYEYFYYLFDVKDKTVRLVELPIIIDALQPKSNFFPLSVDSMMWFRPVDPRTKTIVDVQKIGALMNNLEIKELEFDFNAGGLNIGYIKGTKNYVFETDLGAFLVSDKNKVINSLLFNPNDYDFYYFDNETCVLVDSFTNDAYIYKLSDSSKVAEGEIEYRGRFTGNRDILLLKKGNTYYKFDGTLQELSGDATVFDSARGIYYIKVGEEYRFYYIDGTSLFITKNLASVRRSSYSYYPEPNKRIQVNIYTFEYEMITKTAVVTITYEYSLLFAQ